MNKPRCCKKCRDHIKDGIRVKDLCNNAACECHVAKTATESWEIKFREKFIKRCDPSGLGIMSMWVSREDPEDAVNFIRKTLSLERAAIVERVQALQKEPFGVDNFGAKLYHAGSGDIHYSNAIDDVLAVLTSPDPEKETNE